MSTFHRLLSDDPRFGLSAGDVLECEPYDGDDEKLVVLRRAGDGHDPACTVYRHQVAPAAPVLDPTTLADAPEVLRTVLGSRAYGTARPGSDTDLVVVRAFTPAQLTGLVPPEPRGWLVHTVADGQDVLEMDAQVLLTGVLAGTPRDVEVLHSDPQEGPGGDVLVQARSGLLTAGAVAEGYGRYVRGVAHRLVEGKERDPWKAALTLHRLVVHATRLWTTGTLELRIDRDEAFAVAGAVAAGDLGPVHDLVARAEVLLGSPTVLPQDAGPVTELARSVLARVRAAAG